MVGAMITDHDKIDLSAQGVPQDPDYPLKGQMPGRDDNYPLKGQMPGTAEKALAGIVQADEGDRLL